MKNKKNTEKKTRLVRTLAVTQVLSLVLEIFAISFIFSLSIGGVNANSTPAHGERRSGDFGMYYIYLEKEDSAYNARFTGSGWYTMVEDLRGDKLTRSVSQDFQNKFPLSSKTLSPSGRAVKVERRDISQYGYEWKSDPKSGSSIPIASYSKNADGTFTVYDKDGTALAENKNANDLRFNPELITSKGDFNGHNGQLVSVQVGKDKLNLNLHTTENVGYDPATKKYYDLTIKDEALVGTLQQESPSTTGKKSYDVLGGKTWDTDAYFLGNFVEGLTYAAWVITFTKALGSIMPKGEYKNMFDVVGYSAVAGIMAGYVLYGLGERITGGKSGDLWTGFSVVAGIATAYFIFAKNYIKYDYKEETLVFKCLLWQAPNGGKDCDKCNQDALKPCSEYRCKSLGQSCMLINAGTGKERCINSNPNDVTSPGIKPWINILTKGYAYTDVKERPPGGEVTAGMRITYKGGCLPAFTPFKFGIVTTDNGNNGVILQPAQCKIEYNHTKNFEEMGYYLGDENIYLENHSQAISLPGAKLINTTFPGVKNDNEYTLYIRCKDGNGNANRDEFAVRFCIDPTPDLTAPIIKSTSIASGSAVQYKADNVSISVYTNEPSKCRWSRKDASYDNMENSMNCNNQLWQMNAEMSYTCNTLLTSIKDKQENQFYFRCQDLNNNTQQQSYPYLLYGSQPLTILSTGPTGTIGSSTSTAVVSLSVKTDNGFKNGNSDCYYSTSDSNNSYIKMFQTGGNNHKQDLDLSEGSYKYYIKCADAGGNSASNSTEFKVFTDTYAPAIIRTINYEGKLVVITDEESTCKYSTDSCNFNINSEGIDMPYQNSNTHYAEWKTDQTYYIKCSDKFNNQPEPSECSMTIKPYKINED